ncbi:MAG TPA: multicopper oxidase domain-containing protein [Gaiella sp.]|jgi:FtsP/CotA-like multicopper oxidase with cupredoxin domain|nr:multicopper oxidase domain-containing protein [Gaiella sp.]
MEHHEHHHEHDSTDTTATFPTDTAGLPQAVPTRVVELGDGDTVELRIAPVAKRIGDDTVRMIAYNGSIPGPTLRVREGSELVVDVLNEGDLEATVHWHGLRLENRYDGTHETQAPIPVGGRFAYRISFPDPGVYWYHPHIREDYGQELGQYANILVDPAERDYWPPAHRELLLTLDDIFIEDGKVAPFSRDETTFAAMGRYGNVMLVAGETAPSFAARQGEVVRLYLTNTANTRVFDVAFPGARMKLVGGDSGRVEREAFVESVVLAPSERAVVDVLFEESGRTALEHRTPEQTYTLATFDVAAEPATPSLAYEFAVLRTNPEWSAERERLEIYADAPPDKTLAFVAEMDMPAPEGDVIYVCPMHPDVVGGESDRCPKCGMKLVAVAAPVTYVCPMHPEVVSEQPDRCPKCGMKLVDASLVTASGHGHEDHAHEHHDHPHAEHQHEHEHEDEHDHEAGGIEWEDDMLELNRRTTPANMRWMLVDRDTGAANHGIAWQFTVGDRVKLRLVNEMDSDHPMHHPFHVHGAGRFVVLARDGAPETNYVWKDTVLVRTGETVDILLDITNPGRWMAHCHIAEHHESGMMFSFDVAPADAP